MITTKEELRFYIQEDAKRNGIKSNHVNFAPGSKAFGNITIGDNCFIGANAVVVKDVIDNSCVGGVPSKWLKEQKDIRW